MSSQRVREGLDLRTSSPQERNKTHLRTKFEFDEKHDLKFTKPVERMIAPVREPEINRLLAKATDATS